MTKPTITPFDGQPLTMSSREIAELLESRHDSVKRTMERLSDKGLIRFTPSVETSHEGAGARDVEVYRVGKRDSYVVVAQLSPEFTARLVDRWQELEEAVAKPPFLLDPSDPKVMLACFDYLQKQVQEKDAIIAVQGERVKLLARLEGADGSMCITDAAKTLGVGRNELFRLMASERWIYKRPGNRNWLAYDARRHSGLMDHDDHIYFDGDNRERIATRALVTAKGLIRLAELLGKTLN